MLKQKFRFNDNTDPELYVVGIKSYRYKAMSIQISKVLDLDSIRLCPDHAEVPFKYVYEEINQDDFVTYARYMGKDNIKRNYPWAKELM